MFGTRNDSRRLVIAIVVCGVCVGGAVRVLRGGETRGVNAPAPELVRIARWVNSDGMKVADLRGKVVVLHFWTFGCINCQHNLAALQSVVRGFREG